MHRIPLAVLLTSLVACAAEEPPAGYPTGLGTPTDPVPGPYPYLVRSRFAVPLGVPAVTGAIADLAAFSQHGGTALLAQGVGTPAAAALDALPSTLRSKLDAWIDLELDKQQLGTTTARQSVGQIATMAQTVVDSYIVESTLTITPTGAVHQFIDLTFQPLSIDVVVPIGGLMADTLVAKPTATVAAAGALQLGDQRLGLAFGSHAWQALDLATDQRFGGGLGIIEQLDCNAIAQAVAARCISGSCVGHASDLATLCKAGLTTLVDQLRDALSPLELHTMRFASGSAHLVDDDRDGIADRIVDGTWQLETDVGTGVHAAQVTFTAKEDTGR
ncbi:MAG: hypothetical protein ABI678_10450 [Kofleriaceae bacterium]